VTSRGDDRAILEALFRAGLEAADPAAAVRRAIRVAGSEVGIARDSVPRGARFVVVAAGKAAGPMASALEASIGDRIARGVAVTKDGHGVPLRRIALREAGHPIPDARGENAAREALALAESARPDEVLIVALSGGASALLACPVPGLTLRDLAATTGELLRSGADIEELNAVRKHLSGIGGGNLARRARCRRIFVLCISDVVGDRLDVIASGPCAPDPSTYRDALSVLERRGIRDRIPASVVHHLEEGARGRCDETPKPGDPAFERVRSLILANNRSALEGAQRAAARAGLATIVVCDGLRGEARAVGRRLAALARAVRSEKPVCLLAGGETTVTVRGRGRGGRNQELALAAALELASSRGITLLAAGTDGTDGPTDAAGAYADPHTAARAAALGVQARDSLDRNDSHGFFAAESGLLRTGPTGTNVMDLALLLIRPQGSAA
jgi:hydroxypyruvate reductase